VADLRLFFAARTKVALTELLGGLSASLRSVRDGVKWVDAKNIHLTLKFLGATDESLVGPLTEAARSSVRGTGEIVLGVGGLGTFPNPRRPRVIWVGLTGDVERLISVRDALEEACFSLGFPKEGRAFKAHLTLGRVKDRVSDETMRKIEENRDVSLGEMVVDGIDLIRSDLLPSGAVYTVLSRCPLT
jgi:2'-5' RNA ligase